MSRYRHPPFQPNSPFALMCHFIFKRQRYPRAINLLSFFTRLQPLPSRGLPRGNYSHWVGRGQPMHSSWQLVRHGNLGPHAGWRPQGALKALTGKQWSCVFVCVSKAVYDSLCFVTDCCPNTDPILSPTGLPSTPSTQKVDILPENKLFILSKGKKKWKLVGDRCRWDPLGRTVANGVEKTLSKQILESGQLWLMSLAFLLLFCTYNLGSISLYLTFSFPSQSLNLLCYLSLFFLKIFFLWISLVFTWFHFFFPFFYFPFHSSIYRPYVTHVVERNLSNIDYFFLCPISASYIV